MQKIKNFILLLACIPGTMYAQNLQDGLRAIESDKFEGAKQIFTGLLTKDAANAAVYNYYLGQIYTSTYKTDSAAIAYAAGIAANPNNGINYAGQGELKIMEGKLAEAEVLFAKAVTFNKGKDVRTIRAIASAYLTQGAKYADKALDYGNRAMTLDNSDVDNYILLGDIYLEKQDGGKAATNYEKAAAVNPKDPKPLVKVANIWLRVKNVEACLQALNTAIALDSTYAPVHKSFSQLYYLAKQFEKAKAEYNKYLYYSEPSIANQRQFVNILFLGEFYEDALEIINTILTTNNNDPYLFRLKAYCIYEVGEKNKVDNEGYYQDGIKAIETFLLTISPDKILPSDYAYYGRLQSKIGEDSLAINTMLKALSLDSSDVEMYQEIGKVKNKQRKYDEAAQYFNLSIAKKDKPNVLDYYYLARAYFYAKQYGKSDTAYIRLLELKPDYADAYFARGNCHALLDPEYKDTIAKSMYEKYIEMTQAEPEKYKKNLIGAYSYLGVYAVKHDDNVSAKAHFTKLLELDPENKLAKDALKQL